MKKTCITFFLFLCAFSAQALAKQVSPTELAADYAYQHASLSPDGTKLALNAWLDGRGRIIILDLKTFKTVGAIMFRDNGHPGRAIWVNNERIVTKVLQSRPSLEAPVFYGELYAANYDGSKGLMIYGLRVDDFSTGTRLNRKKATRGWGDVLHTLPQDEDHILISSTSYERGVEAKPTVHELNVYNGKMSRRITQSPLPNGNFILNEEGEVKIAYAGIGDDKVKAYALDSESDEWTELELGELGSSFVPRVLDETGRYLYVTDSGKNGNTGLFKYDLQENEVTHLFTDEKVSITSIQYSASGQNAYAVRVDDGRPAYVMFNNESEEAKLYKDIVQSFPGNAVSLESKSADGTKWIVDVDSDITPGTFYLYDKEQNQLQFLVRNLEHIPIEQMSESKPIQFTASDGVNINGYISYPVGIKADQKVPLVALVHGGPHGVRDYWTFDREVQLLTTQGYAVLRVNYRGSGGYGYQFLASGYKEWGNRIQHDIIDGIRWAANLKNIDAKKICIMGGSFGAYSAVMSASLAPDLFKCVVANAGLYDLELMYEDGDIPDMLYGRNYLERALGTDKSLLQKFSPVNFVEKIQAPILIAHGKKDVRTPFVHAENLRSELEKHNKPFEWFIRDTEAHGFFDPENRGAFFEEVSKFLENHLK